MLNHFCARFTNIPVSVMSCFILHPSLVTINHLWIYKIILSENFIIDVMLEMEEVSLKNPLQDGNHITNMTLPQKQRQ